MDLPAFLKTIPRAERAAMRARIAKAAQVSPAAVRHWANGIRGISPAAAIAIESATDGAVTCAEVRPDLEWSRDSTGAVTGYRVPVASSESSSQQVA